MTPSPAPVPFIVGVGRSGTTLLRLMLDAHPQLAIPPEFNWLEPVLPDLQQEDADPQAIADKIVATQSWPDLDISETRLRALLEAVPPGKDPSHFLRGIYADYAARFGKLRFGDKTPKNLQRMAWQQTAFPEARFIHIIRDGRDVALSAKDVFFGERAAFPNLLKSWRDQIFRARKQSAQLNHYLEIRYEDLVTDTQTVLERVCAFIELDLDPAMLNYHRTAPDRLAELKDMQHHRPVPAEERRRMFALTSQPPSETRIGRWKHQLTEEQKAEALELAGRMLNSLDAI